MRIGRDSLAIRSELKIGAKTYKYFSLAKARQQYYADLDKLPFSLKGSF